MSRKSQTSISVLMPIYNAERYLPKAIDSLLNQSFSDLEIIAINDGSTDSSQLILDRYAKNDKRIQIISRENRGLIATLNQGIEIANAPLIARMDADDICHPLRLEKQAAYLEIHPECVAVGSRVMLIDPEGLPLCTFAEDTSHDAVDAAHLKGKGGAIAHPTALIRKSILKSVGGYRYEFPHAEDIDLFLRLAEVGKLANLPDILLEYRQHLDSVGYQYRKIQQNSAKCAVKEALHRRNIGDVKVDHEVPVKKHTDRRVNIHTKWAWWALQGGNLQTARKHAWKAVLSSPYDYQAWKALVCAVRGA